MPYEFAGAYDAAVLDSNSLLLKNTAFELVTEPGGVLTPLYTNRTRSGPVAQPFLSDAEGNVHIFADPGRYRLRQAGSPPGEEITVQPDPDETEGELEAHVVAPVPHPGYLSDTDHDARDHSVPAGTVVLDDLQNVTVPAPALNDVLTFDGANWVNAVSSGGLSPAAHDARDHSVPAGTVALFDLENVGPAAPVLPVSMLALDPVTQQWGPSPIVGSVDVGPAITDEIAYFDASNHVGGDLSMRRDPAYGALLLDRGIGETLTDGVSLLALRGGPLRVRSQDGENNPSVRVDFAGDAPNGENANVTFFRSRGTLNARTNVLALDILGQVLFRGQPGSGARGGLSGVTTENWTAGAQGTRLLFVVTPSGTAAGQVSAMLDNNGRLYLRKGMDPNVEFPLARIDLRPSPSEVGQLIRLDAAPGNAIEIESSAGTDLFIFDSSGFPKWVAAKESLTVGAAGAAAPPPITPTKWLMVKDSAGVTLKVAAYAA